MKRDFLDIRTRVFKKISALTRFSFTDQTNLQDELALDSLDITGLILELEEELKVDLNSIPLDPILTIQDLIISFSKVSMIRK